MAEWPTLRFAAPLGATAGTSSDTGGANEAVSMVRTPSRSARGNRFGVERSDQSDRFSERHQSGRTLPAVALHSFFQNVHQHLAAFAARSRRAARDEGVVDDDRGLVADVANELTFGADGVSE